MGYSVGNGGNLSWVIVRRVVVICYVWNVGNLSWVIVWRGVVICYGLLCGEWW